MIEQSNTKSANFDLSSLDLLDLSDPFFPDDKAHENKGEKYIVFFLDSETYAVASKHVDEIFHPLLVTPLPNVPSWLIGIANFRNDILSVVDLQKLWKKEDAPISPKSKLLVLRSDNGDSRIAFTIDKFSEIVSLPEDGIEGPDEGSLDYINGKSTHKSTVLNLIDAQKLLSLGF